VEKGREKGVLEEGRESSPKPKRTTKIKSDNENRCDFKIEAGGAKKGRGRGEER